MPGITTASNGRLRHTSPSFGNTVGTMCFWFRPSATAGVNNLRLSLVSGLFLMEMDTGNVVQIRGTGGPTFTLNGGTFVSGTLFFIAVILNTTGTIVRLYQNGVQAATTTYTGAPVACTGVHVGEEASMTPGTFYDVRFFDRELSANEIMTIYSCGGRDGITHGCLMELNFTEAAVGTTIVDNMIKNPYNPSSILDESNGPTIAESTGGAPQGYRRRAA